MHLKRANARREIEQSGGGMNLQPAHQCVDPKAQGQIEFERSVFDQ